MQCYQMTMMMNCNVLLHLLAHSFIYVNFSNLYSQHYLSVSSGSSFVVFCVNTSPCLALTRLNTFSVKQSVIKENSVKTFPSMCLE